MIQIARAQEFRKLTPLKLTFTTQSQLIFKALCGFDIKSQIEQQQYVCKE